jgi:uncharacterized membrane protein (UPF0127 family)
MNKRLLSTLFAACLLLSAPAIAADGAAADAPAAKSDNSGGSANAGAFEKTRVTEKTDIVTAAGKTVTLELEIAKTPVDIQIGLMFRREMAEDHGMLFQLSREPQPTAFWMKNTYIPLDMLFVAKNGEIVNVHRNAQPLSTVSIPSLKPVTGVIEINGGMADKLGIDVGDTVKHPFFARGDK